MGRDGYHRFRNARIYTALARRNRVKKSSKKTTIPSKPFHGAKSAGVQMSNQKGNSAKPTAPLNIKSKPAKRGLNAVLYPEKATSN